MLNGYELTSSWFLFVAENSDKVECKHTALYLYIVEQFNKRHWVEVVGLPTDFTMSILNMSSYKTYSKTLSDLIDFGFVKMVENARNQHTSNKIALVKNAKADTKAVSKHIPKQVESSDQSTSSIIKLNKLLNSKTIKLLNDNAALVNDNLQKWIDSEIEESKPKEELSARDEIFKKWFDYRKQIKKPLKDVSIESLKSTWSSKSDEDLKLIIEQSISNGWQGLFELKQQPNQQSAFQQDKPFDPNRMMPAWELEAMLRAGKLNTNT